MAQAPLTSLEAFAGQLTSMRPQLQAAAWRLCGSESDAEDLLHDTLERALRKLEQFRPDTSLRAWLLSIMRRRFIDNQRAARREAAVLWTTLLESEQSSDRETAEPSMAEVMTALDSLAPALRETLRLFACERLSYRQISERLRISEVTVGTRILRARRRVRDAVRTR